MGRVGLRDQAVGIVAKGLILGALLASAPLAAQTETQTLAIDPRDRDVLSEDRTGTDEPIESPNRRQPTDAEILRDFQLSNADPATLTAFTAPTLPALSAYTAAGVEAKIDRSRPGTVSVGSMLVEAGFRPLITLSGRGLREFVQRQNGSVRAIFVENGYVSLPQMARELPHEIFEQVSPGRYIARLPILVRHGATLHLGADVTELRLSQDRGALLANEGNLFITKSAVIGWNEAAKAPAKFRSEQVFRPFIVSWSGSQTYIVQSRIANLGYSAVKATGLSISTYTRSVPEREVWGRPTGWILNSEIEDLWDALYCRETDDLVVRGNTIKNNILYGIDLHEDSKRLIVAENTVSGTRRGHGIIFSGAVANSWIFDNRSFENALSGIVIDRQSHDNVITRNLAYRNKASGILVAESPRNLLLDNVATGNQQNGIRVRNSSEIRLQNNSAIANGLAGVSAVAVDLTSARRNTRIDPYSRAVTVKLVGGQLTGNGSGPINIDDPTRVEIYDLDLRTPQRALGYRLGGVLLTFQIDVIDILVNQKRVAVIERRKPSASEAAH